MADLSMKGFFLLLLQDTIYARIHTERFDIYGWQILVVIAIIFVAVILYFLYK